MNELLPLSGGTSLTIEVDRLCAEHAEAIRVLGKRVARDIIEIGQRLIAVKETLPHGAWLPWIEAEFGWSDETARKFISVAERFGSLKSQSSWDLPALTIDASALYALAGPGVPDAARLEAIERAEAGERITKLEADDMVARATREAAEQAIASVQAEQDEQLEQAIAEVTARISGDQAKLQDEIRQLKKEARKVDIDKIAKTLCTHLKKKTLGDDQWRLLAQLLDTPISNGKTTFSPISKEDMRRHEEHLLITSKIGQAFEAIAGAPPPDAICAIAWPVQLRQHRRAIDGIINWLCTYRNLIDQQGTNP